MQKRDAIIGIVIIFNFFLGTYYFMNKGYSSMSRNIPAQPLPVATVEVYDVSLGFIGNGTATYTLVEFGDYECPPCKNAHRRVVALLKQYPQKLRFQFRNFPLKRIHPAAMSAAIIAEEARRSNRFAEVHNALYETKANLTRDAVAQIAQHYKVVGDEKDARRQIESDTLSARRVGIDGTPTFILCRSDGTVLLLNSIDDVSRYLTN